MSKADRVEEFVRLYTSYEVRLRAFVMSMIPNFTDAEDVLQQANLLLWKRFDQFQPGTNFMSWAGRVVYLVALQHRQKRAQEKLQFGEAFTNAVANVATREDFSARLGERERALGECVTKLKSDHQEMLRVRYAEGGSIEQMSVLFNRSAEAVYNALSRIRRVLHDCVSLKLRAGATDGRSFQ